MDFLRFIPYHSAKISLNDNRAKNETPFPLQSKLLKIKRMAAVILFFAENTVRDRSEITGKSTDKNRIGEAGFLMPRDGYGRGTRHTNERQMLTRKKPERKKCKRKKRRAGISDLCVFRQKGDIFTKKDFQAVPLKGCDGYTRKKAYSSCKPNLALF